MRFSKRFAVGKDYVCIETISTVLPHALSALARAMCDRHFGAGADGLVLLERSDRADVRLRTFDGDGREAVPEPSGVCCAAGFAHALGISHHDQVRVEAGKDVRFLTLSHLEDMSIRVKVDLGPPILQADRIPTTLPGNPPVEVPVTFPGTMHNVTAVSVGGPYAVIFVRELSHALVADIGAQMEKHPAFPQRTSVAFVKVDRPDDITARVWERNAGEASASANGAAAITVAGTLTGRTQRKLVARFSSGDVLIDWSLTDNHVHLGCTVSEIYRADWPDHS